MANIKLTARSDGSIYLQCRCGEIGQPCTYQGEVAYPPEGISLLRHAKQEAYNHCWQAHRLFAYLVNFEIVRPDPPAPPKLKPFLVTTEPKQAETAEEIRKRSGGAK